MYVLIIRLTNHKFTAYNVNSKQICPMSSSDSFQLPNIPTAPTNKTKTNFDKTKNKQKQIFIYDYLQFLMFLHAWCSYRQY